MSLSKLVNIRFLIYFLVVFITQNSGPHAMAGFEWVPAQPSSEIISNKDRTSLSEPQTPKVQKDTNTFREPSTLYAEPIIVNNKEQALFLPLPGTPHTSVQPENIQPHQKPPKTLQSQPISAIGNTFNNTGSLQETIRPSAGSNIPETYNVVTGFGSDMPMALALRQIVPPHYAFSFGEGVNPGYRVSWTGDKPWNQIVHDMIKPLDLTVYVHHRKLYVVKNHGLSQTIPDKAYPMINSSPIQTQHTYGDIRAQKNAERITNRVSQIPNPDPAPNMFDGRREGVTDPGQHIRPQPAQTLARMKRITNFDDAQRISAQQNNQKHGDTIASYNKSSAVPLIPVDALPPVTKTQHPLVHMPQTFQYRDHTKPSMATNSNHQHSYSWTAHQGDSLKHVLSTWAKEANVELLWQSSQDFIVQRALTTNKPFQKAVHILIENSLTSEKRPSARFFETPGQTTIGALLITP